MKLYFIKTVGNTLVLFALIALMSSFVAKRAEKEIVYRYKYIYLKPTKDKTESKMSLKDSIKLELKKLKVQHADLVYTQFVIESGHFKHFRFTKNNNLAGLKVAGSRPSTAIGKDKDGYAIYSSWRDAILDYCLLQSAHAKNLNREEYFKWLENYSNSKDYVKLIKKML